MILAPFNDASLTVQIHLGLALLALVLGPFVIWRKRRDRVHKALGYVWVAAMVGTSLVAFAIPTQFATLGVALAPLHLGPIHLLAVYALWGIGEAMVAIYRGQVRRHEQTMRSVYVRGLVLAGAFTLLPGRILQQSLIPDAPALALPVIVCALVWAFGPFVRGRLAARWVA